MADLFTVLARLTLDANSYNSALKQAERDAQSFHGDAEGTISAEDEYSGTLASVEHTADAATIAEVDGDVKADEKYTADLAGAQAAAKGAEIKDVKGDIKANETYSASLSAADANASAAQLADVNGVIDAEQNYIPELDDAEGEASGAHLETAVGDIVADESYTSDLDAAESAAASANEGGTLNVSGSIEIADNGSEALQENQGQIGIWQSVFNGAIEGIAQGLTGGIIGSLGKIGNLFSQMISDTANYADSVDKGSRAMSMSTETYQEWSHALSQSGASISDIRRGWRNLTNTLAGNGSEQVQEALASLNIDPKQYKTTEALFSAVIQGLAGITDNTTRDNLVTTIFGPNGTQLNALLDSGAEGIRDLIQESHDLGLIMSGEEIENGVAYGDALANMQAALAGLRQTLVSDILPILTDAMTQIAGIIGWLTGRTNDRSLEERFRAIDNNLADTFADATTGETTVMGLIGHLRELTDGTEAVIGKEEEWELTAQRLIALCPALANQIDIVNHRIDEQTGSLEENAAEWYRNIRVQAVEQALADKRQLLVEQSNKILDKQLEEIEKTAEAEGHIQNVRSGILEMAESVRDSGNTWEMEGMLNLLNEIEGFSYDAATGAFDFSGVADKDLPAVIEALAGYSAIDPHTLHLVNEQLDLANQATAAAASAGEEAVRLQGELETMTERYQLYEQSANELMDRINTEADDASGNVSGLSAELAALPSDVNINVNIRRGGLHSILENEDVDGSFAKGIDYVPTNEYLATLHRGEAVLSGNEARAWRERGGRGQDYGGSGAVVAAIQGLSNDLQNLRLYVGERAFGGAVVDYGGRGVNQYIGGAGSRRRRGYGRT